MTTQTIHTQMPELPQAARLHLARYLAGMEIKDLAQATGISRNTIANYESLDWDRKRNPAYIRVWALATGMSYEWLLGDVPSGGDGLRQEHRRYAQDDGSVPITPFRPPLHLVA